jgi:hypothetical protein
LTARTLEATLLDMKSAVALGLWVSLAGCGGATPEPATGASASAVQVVTVAPPPETKAEAKAAAPPPVEPAKPPPEKTAPDREPKNTENAMTGEVDEAFGSGGLGLSGSGIGVGGIGLGGLGTIGHGAGTGTGQGFGNGQGRLAGSSSSPQIRMGATTVSGRLPPEVVQRIVRQNFGRFRLCYEVGIRKDPKLGGKLTVHFVIDTKGAVSGVTNGGSDLKSTEVIACVLGAFAPLVFPAPESGIAVVDYPMIFTPATAAPPKPSP